jgi:hypothetical protein
LWENRRVSTVFRDGEQRENRATVLAAQEVPPMRLSPVVDQVRRGHRLRGGMLSVCTEPGCTMLTMGGTCVAHDPPVTMVFPRGRPYTTTAEEGAVEQVSRLTAPVA